MSAEHTGSLSRATLVLNSQLVDEIITLRLKLYPLFMLKATNDSMREEITKFKSTTLAVVVNFGQYPVSSLLHVADSNLWMLCL